MSTAHPYVRLARLTVECMLNGKTMPLSGEDAGNDAALWGEAHACFVSIKTLDGALRGCIGTILPTQSGLDKEIIANAIAASTRDPRFKPMVAEELSNVKFSVDVLSLPEPISSHSELDPSVWGIILSKGPWRGVLLPNLEGISTVEEQLNIAAQKAGIHKIDSEVTIEKFSVKRYEE